MQIVCELCGWKMEEDRGKDRKERKREEREKEERKRREREREREEVPRIQACNKITVVKLMACC